MTPSDWSGPGGVERVPDGEPDADIPTISIVIPTFDRSDLLLSAVSSALAQEGVSLEVVVVNDGSRDKAALSTLESLVDVERVSVISQVNQGVAVALNTGIKSARGKYILPLGDDDYLAPSYARKAIQLLEADNSLGVVYCRARMFGELDGPWNLPEFSPARMALGNCVFACAVFRKSDWEAVGGYRGSLRGGYEDYDLWIRMLMLGKGFKQIPEVLFYYRVGHPSLTQKYRADKALKNRLLREVRTANSDFFAQHIDVIFNELEANREEADRWRRIYGGIDPVARPFILRARHVRRVVMTQARRIPRRRKSDPDG